MSPRRYRRGARSRSPASRAAPTLTPLASLAPRTAPEALQHRMQRGSEGGCPLCDQQPACACALAHLLQLLARRTSRRLAATTLCQQQQRPFPTHVGRPTRSRIFRRQSRRFRARAATPQVAQKMRKLTMHTMQKERKREDVPAISGRKARLTTSEGHARVRVALGVWPPPPRLPSASAPCVAGPHSQRPVSAGRRPSRQAGSVSPSAGC